MPEALKQQLRAAYDRKIEERDSRTAPAWETEERDLFLDLLQQEHKHSLLELGAATGTDGQFFQDAGLEVVCTDLSPEMVSRCQKKGLTACVMDVAELQFPADSFDAVYAMNCLVHVPKVEWLKVLQGINRVLKANGLCYVGVYGGYEHEGSLVEDGYEPKRFFSLYTDEQLQNVLRGILHLHAFRHIPHGWAGLHFQSAIVRKAE